VYRLLGENDRARREFEYGLDVARRWGAAQWIAEAEQELAR
jgi:hypothetical protein